MILTIFNRLLEQYGPQYWWPARTPFEMMVGAILTQNTAWTNVEKAIINLEQAACLTPQAIVNTPHPQLAQWLKPSGYFNVKAVRLQQYCRWYLAMGEHQGLAELDTITLREKLLTVPGIGPETADDIVLYAFQRPVFVIDAYTRRLLQRLKLIQGKESYETLRLLMENNLPADAALFNEYHALIVTHAKQRCRKQKPRCEGCSLFKACHRPHLNDDLLLNDSFQQKP